MDHIWTRARLLAMRILVEGSGVLDNMGRHVRVEILASLVGVAGISMTVAGLFRHFRAHVHRMAEEPADKKRRRTSPNDAIDRR